MLRRTLRLWLIHDVSGESQRLLVNVLLLLYHPDEEQQTGVVCQGSSRSQILPVYDFEVKISRHWLEAPEVRGGSDVSGLEPQGRLWGGGGTPRGRAGAACLCRRWEDIYGQEDGAEQRLFMVQGGGGQHRWNMLSLSGTNGIRRVRSWWCLKTRTDSVGSLRTRSSGTIIPGASPTPPGEPCL